ncbi:hypothetical protein [Polymorphobacter sp.]|uniref:hypothetical protein n=1 Tax=Polymorphobacter sp. TaxID=1909290 RepID=UPI003F72D6AF
MEYDFSYVGNELDQMLHHGKPMSAFCRAVSENIDEFSGQDFLRYVQEGKIIKDIFFVGLHNERCIYTVFTKPDQHWRFNVYKALKKSGQKIWSNEQEFLESYLLGYIR